MDSARAPREEVSRKTVHIADDETSNSPRTSYTASSGSERVPVVEVLFPERHGHSSAGSTSVHSGSFSSASSGSSYVQVEHYDEEEEDDIEPSDSASRSRLPPPRRTTEPRPAPTRQHSSRRTVERDEVPRRRSSHTHHASRHHRRAEPRRTPSDESSSVASGYDEHYSHHGAPQLPRVPYPPSGYRHVPAPSHGGYPPNMTSAPSYAPHDPFVPPQQAMVHMNQHPDPFGYPPATNPFSSHAQPQNPFSPMSSGGGSSYFATDAHAPQAPMAPPPHLRPPGPARPQSFAAPSSYAGSHYGSEMAMAPYPGSVHPSMASGMPPYPYGMPGYPPVPQWGYGPPSHTSSPAPPAAAPKEDTSERDEKTSAELQALKDLIAKHEEARLAAEKERLARAEADAAAAAHKKAEEEAAKRRKEEIAMASAKAKEDAEKVAEEAAKKAKEEHEKAVAEATKAQEEAEKKAKALQDQVEKSKPAPDSLQAPIKFKDAVGRKFSFPWQLCKTWKGMESLIKQAFLHVDVIGDHVHAGHYDLTGPDGEIILPQVWDSMIKPDWDISMHMWPMPEEKPPKEDKLAKDAAALGDPFHGLDFGKLDIMDVGVGPRPSKSKRGKDGKSKKPKAGSPDMVHVPPMMPPPPMGSSAHGSPPLPPPPVFPPGMLSDLGYPPGIAPVMDDRRTRPKAKSKGKSEISPWTAWMVGAPVRPKKR